MSKLPFKEKERLKWQCRRGMLELDCLLEHFLHEHYDHQTEQTQIVFRHLLREADPHIFHWLIAAPEDAPDKYRELLQLIRF